jgi:hypothetical protein
MVSISKAEHTIKLDHIIGAAHVHKRVGDSPSVLNICCKSEMLTQWSDSISSTPTGFWSIFAMVIEKDKKGDLVNPRLREIRFSSENESTSSEECVQQVRSALGYTDSAMGSKKLLFLLNPFGGTKSSRKVYHTIVVPMLRMAGLEDKHELVETKNQHHATEVGKHLDVSKYRCAVTISGDGVFHELLNGLLARKDWKAAIELPIGTIGAGIGS